MTEPAICIKEKTITETNEKLISLHNNTKLQVGKNDTDSHNLERSHWLLPSTIRVLLLELLELNFTIANNSDGLTDTLEFLRQVLDCSGRHWRF